MDELRTAPDFMARWSRFGTTEKGGYGAHRAPDMGGLRFNYEVSYCPLMTESNVSSPCFPADDATAVALAGAGNPAVPSSPLSSRHR